VKNKTTVVHEIDPWTVLLCVSAAIFLILCTCGIADQVARQAIYRWHNVDKIEMGKDWKP
jgi:hypothetical protein